MKNKLSITQAAKICNFERSYFYKIMKKYNVSVKKDGAGKSYIDPAELCRALPLGMINNELLDEYVGNTREATLAHNTTTQNNTGGNELIDILKKQVLFLEQQLEIAQSQVNGLLDTVNRQTLLLGHKPTINSNTVTQETIHTKTQETTEQNNMYEATENITGIGNIFTKLRNKQSKPK